MPYNGTAINSIDLAEVKRQQNINSLTTTTSIRPTNIYSYTDLYSQNMPVIIFLVIIIKVPIIMLALFSPKNEPIMLKIMPA